MLLMPVRASFLTSAAFPNWKEREEDTASDAVVWIVVAAVWITLAKGEPAQRVNVSVSGRARARKRH